jgi:L,D-peptidoglycan transpeptidase YkuD (ErfK/YbiS/YcfS/YnhG family)
MVLPHKYSRAWAVKRLEFLMFGVVIAFGEPALADHCPMPISDALRLVLVTTPSMNSLSANMRLYTRSATDQSWKQIGGSQRAVVGAAGLGWGNTFLQYRKEGEFEKHEGDRRTPAGFFRLGPSFGFSKSDLPRYVRIKAGETVCVEDPSSASYNKIARRSEIADAANLEDMSRTPLYRHGLFVDYPTDRAGRRGSCIFIHIWQTAYKGTAGCIGLREDRVAMLQEFSRPGSVLAVLPNNALDRFSSCLPDLAGSR